MKYTFYRCFTHSLSVHRSPKMYVPKGHLQWTSTEQGEEGLIMRCLAMCVKGLFTELTFICLMPVHVLDTTAQITNSN